VSVFSTGIVETQKHRAFIYILLIFLYIDPFATEVVLFLKSEIGTCDFVQSIIAGLTRNLNLNLNPRIHDRLTMCGGLRVKPAMTEGVVAMTVRFVFSCL
jgi:hypothetical protein